MIKKKILFVIYSSHPKSGGGHFYSLNTITKALEKKIDYRILNIGLVYSKSLEKSMSDFIYLKKKNILNERSKISRFVKKINPDIIHCFDSASLSVMRIANYRLNIPIIFQKCGGVNGGKFIQYADAYINFSQENTDHFLKFKKNNSPIYTIPNRAHYVEPDFRKINELKKRLHIKPNEKIILRISRFHELHEASIIQAVNLLKLIYKNEEKNYRLIIIGMPQSREVLERVREDAENVPVAIITEEYYTHQAAGLLDIADIIVATGRGVMEAASLNKKIFAPVKGEKLPAPLNPENLKNMLYFNFSGRTSKIDNSLQAIQEFINGEKGYEKFINKTFMDHFYILNAVDRYLSIYNITKTHKEHKINLLMDFFRFIKPKYISKNFYSKNINS